jgi:thymidylate kinase
LKIEENSEILHLKALLSFLDQENIEYCILGNTMGFPNKIHGDIDIVVRPAQISLLNEFLCNFAKNRRIRIIQVFQHEQMAWCYVFSWLEDHLKPKFLSIDICGDYFWNGQSLISANELLKERIQKTSRTSMKTSFYTPNPEKAFIYYLIKKVVKQGLTHKQTQYLWTEWDKDPAGCKKQIKRFWAEKDVDKIVWALEKNKYNALNDLIPGLKKSLRKNLNFSILHLSKEIKRIVQRILKPTGLSVAFIGPDGSGKSSIIEHIHHNLMPAFRKTYVYHLRPRITLRNQKISLPVKNPHAKAPRGQLSSFFKIFYYLFDYSIGYVLKIWPLIISSTLVLFDRYYHDILVDPKRFRYGASTWLAELIGRTVPKPNLWILLDSPPDIIQTRKQETSYEETNRQCKAYIEISKRLNNCFVVDASAPLNSVVVDVNNAILTFLAKRTEGRIGY